MIKINLNIYINNYINEKLFSNDELTIFIGIKFYKILIFNVYEKYYFLV